jgi:hypothetical protein
MIKYLKSQRVIGKCVGGRGGGGGRGKRRRRRRRRRRWRRRKRRRRKRRKEREGTKKKGGEGRAQEEAIVSLASLKSSLNDPIFFEFPLPNSTIGWQPNL